ncbi:MAG TPA: hypothetical protein VKY35_00675 [Aliidiomarina sp.]|nr:hypothetical protein [Aliidiomarina sp.]
MTQHLSYKVSLQRLPSALLGSVILFFLLLSFTAQANLVEEERTAPAAWDGQFWLVMPLDEGDSGAYYQAHQSSARYLYDALGWGWPTKKISAEVNLDMVRHHISQHQLRDSFTYVVRARGERAIAGAIYVNQVNSERRHVPNFEPREFAAEVTFWFTEQTEASEHADLLISEVLTWIEQEWQFPAVLLPVNKNYHFIHQEMRKLEYEPFSEDGDSGEQLYRLP